MRVVKRSVIVCLSSDFVGPHVCDVRAVVEIRVSIYQGRRMEKGKQRMSKRQCSVRQLPAHTLRLDAGQMQFFKGHMSIALKYTCSFTCWSCTSWRTYAFLWDLDFWMRKSSI